MSSKKAHFPFSNISTWGHLKSDPPCSYLPVTSKFGWNLQSQLLQLSLPVLLILPVTCIPSACRKQKRKGAQQEQGSSRGSVDFPGICNKKQTNKKLKENVEPGWRDRNESCKHSPTRRARKNQCILAALSTGELTLKGSDRQVQPWVTTKTLQSPNSINKEGQASFLWHYNVSQLPPQSQNLRRKHCITKRSRN